MKSIPVVYREGLKLLAYLSRLTLSNFRNLLELDLRLPPGLIVFFGPNAQGKTTLLEAVYLLAIARSFRAENEREVVNFQAARDGGGALVGGVVAKGGEQLQVFVGYQCSRDPGAVETQPNGPASRSFLGRTVRKEIRVSRIRRTAAELVGLIPAVLFSAEDLRLVQGSPSDRRRFLDILISQADPRYLKGLQRYQRVVQQRNQLLRLLRDGRAGEDELAFWDEELVKEGSWIIWRRQAAMEVLARICAGHHRRLGGTDEDLQLEYRPSAPLGEDLQATEDRFRQALAASGQRERAVLATAVGPHRDDFSLLVDGVDMGVFASRGQARTLALTLRLAEAAYLASVRGEGPIVLLDDVLSELDSDRRRRVLEQITQYEQTLITTTEPELMRGFFGTAAAYFRVSGGGVHSCQ